MNIKKVQEIIVFLESKGVAFEAGLTPTEFKSLKEQFNVYFPSDLHFLLSTALPVSKNFPNWRNLLHGSDAYLQASLSHPVEGVLFDVEKNDFWYLPWGDRPKDLSQALVVAAAELAKVPQLVRVYSH